MVVGAGFQPALQTRIGRENATTKSSNLESTSRPLTIAMDQSASVCVICDGAMSSVSICVICGLKRPCDGAVLHSSIGHGGKRVPPRRGGGSDGAARKEER